ncbi:DUF4394 domain-containing protein [Streptomyces sp. NPDC002187]|uniref:DUF4394 domain-containing protein n=1 Tax=Streptomyces sp. NPDC002187 TaxID=3364637 RepID=UPI0036B1DE8D
MRAAVIALALAAAVSTAAPASAADTALGDDGLGRVGLKVTGLTSDQRLVQFPVNRPRDVRPIGAVSGLAPDTALVGIDYRVQDGRLYGVGDLGGIYTLNTSTAQATKVSQLTIPLSGALFGVDFNPAANRLRIISDTGQNLRHNIDDPSAPLVTISDGTLTNLTVPPSTALGVTGAAYTNNDLNPATATTLFDIDTNNDRVAIQSPANAGTLAPTGNLGLDVGPSAGFDIYYWPKSGANQGYAALRSNGSYGFYRVDILDGVATNLGAFPSDRQVVDVALPLNQRKIYDVMLPLNRR